MVSRNSRRQPLLVAIVLCAMIAITSGIANNRLSAQATDLTTLDDAAITAYRWQAMARFYTNQAATDLRYLNDAAITAYRWQAMAQFYTKQTAMRAVTR
ncbi:MAG: hypothetical protein R3C14_13775 [Caldilineaceae bacterium]